MDPGTPVLTCRLDHVSLFAVLTAIESAALTGVLRVEDTTIEFESGQPVTSRDRGAEYKHLLGLFLIESGDATFVREEVSGEPLADPLAIQMHGCRLADEWQRLRHAVFSVVDSSGLHPPLVERLTGRVTLQRALARAGCTFVDVVDEVTSALEDGRLAVVEHRVEEMPERTFDEWIARGRAALKRRDFDIAIEAFEEALALEPTSKVAAQNLRRTIDVRTQWSQLA